MALQRPRKVRHAVSAEINNLPDEVRERRRNDGFGGASLGWIRPHRMGEEEASAELCAMKPVTLRASPVGVFKYGQVGSRLGTDDELSY
jgi:hypothetical protein